MLEVQLETRYTELEAEVEADGPYRASRLSWQRKKVRDEQMRLEPSLVEALATSFARFILLEGDPGSGKTVSLRKAERSFAQRIRHQPASPLPMPLYVNLKHLVADRRKPVEQLHLAVLRALHAEPERAAKLFEQGSVHGGWLLLLDGFDEIPGLLGAIEADRAVQAYTEGIRELCNTIHLDPRRSCRAVVSTRHYLGSKGGFWARFRLRPLSEDRRHAFIANFKLTDAQTRWLIDSLATSTLEIQQWATNPLMLSMLCELARKEGQFPGNVHTLFERYLALRLQRDAGRVLELYQDGPAALRRAAEDIAFVISAESGLGQAPSNRVIREALERQGLPVDGLQRALDAISGLDLALHVTLESEVHTCFKHRRLQEYFATCVLLREPDRVSAEQILFDGRWREAGVVLLQRGQLAEVEALLARVREFLRACMRERGIVEADVDPSWSESATIAWTVENLKAPGQPQRFYWPKGLHHVLGLLHAGFPPGSSLPEDIRRLCTSFLVHIYRTGTRLDRKYIMELIGLLPHGVAEGFCLAAFDSESELLHDLAFRQIPRLGRVSAESRLRISRLLVRMARSGALAQERLATAARIRRANNTELMDLFAMALASVTAARRVRWTLFAIWLAASLVVVASTRAEGHVLMVLVLSLTLPLMVQSISITSHVGLLMLRFFADMITVMVFTLAISLTVFGLNVLGLLCFCVSFVAATYAYLWDICALVSVWDATSVPRQDWPLLPIRFIAARIRRKPALLLIPAALLPLMGLIIVVELVYGGLGQPPDLVLAVLCAPVFAFLAVLAFCAARLGLLMTSDAWTERRHRRAPESVLTVAEVKDKLGKLHTGWARVRFSRALRSERPYALAPLDDGSREELHAFVYAYEAHASVVARLGDDELKRFIRRRLPLAVEYVQSCTSDAQRWCLVHCRTSESMTEVAVMIDVLTDLLERADTKRMSTDSGSARPPAALADSAVAESSAAR